MGNAKKKSKQNRFIIVTGLVLMYMIWFPQTSIARVPEQIQYESPVFTADGEVEYPPEVMEEDEKTYRRISAEIKDVQKSGTLTYVSSTIPYELEGDQEPPETAVITVTDDITGRVYEREVRRQEILEKGLIWKSDFSFSITVFGCDADVFFLGDHEIPAEADLTEYGELFLEFLSLPQEFYHVERVEWSGDAYEQDGVICRDAMAYGEKLLRSVDVTYGGQIKTPDVPAKQYVAVYEEVVEEERSAQAIETDSAMNFEEQEQESDIQVKTNEQSNPADEMIRWIREHITIVAFGGLFLLCFLGWILLLYLSGKKNDRKAGN